MVFGNINAMRRLSGLEHPPLYVYLGTLETELESALVLDKYDILRYLFFTISVKMFVFHQLLFE